MSAFDDLKQKAESAVATEKAKATAWFGANRYPFLIGFGSCALLWAFVHFIL